MEIPLATPLVSRDGTLTRDAKMVNCYWETNTQGQKIVVKRPGLKTGAKLAAGQGQGVLSMGVVDMVIQNDTLYGVGAWSGITPTPLTFVTTPNQRMSVLNSNQLGSGTTLSIIKSTLDAWVMTSLVSITHVGSLYPALTVPGIAYLDGTYYVMTPAGEIYGSALEDPLTWTSLNFISTDRGLGKAVALARHLNYIVAFCEKGLQFFYDAGNPGPGSPLLPVQNATTMIGCSHADSIQEIDDTLVFLGIDASGGCTVRMIKGLSVGQLSDSNVDRVLAANRVLSTYGQMYSMMLKADGHLFYLLTINNLTLACDMDLGTWAQWSTCPDGVTDNALEAGFVLRPRTGTISYFLARTTGQTYSLGTATDETIHFLIRTRPLDVGSTSRKTLSELALFADTVAATINVRYSDNDASTWTSQRTIDLSLVRKRLTRLGSFVRRVFEFSSMNAMPLRIESMLLPDRNLPAQTVPSGE